MCGERLLDRQAVEEDNDGEPYEQPYGKERANVKW
jgi:hypothetical protein